MQWHNDVCEISHSHSRMRSPLLFVQLMMVYEVASHIIEMTRETQTQAKSLIHEIGIGCQKMLVMFVSLCKCWYHCRFYLSNWKLRCLSRCSFNQKHNNLTLNHIYSHKHNQISIKINVLNKNNYGNLFDTNQHICLTQINWICTQKFSKFQ